MTQSFVCNFVTDVVHLTTVSNKPARHQLEPVVKQFFRMDNEGKSFQIKSLYVQSKFINVINDTGNY